MATWLELLDQQEYQDAVAEGVREALEELRPDLATELMGGTQLAYNLAFKRRSVDEVRLFADGFFDSGVPDPEGGKYDYVAIAGQKRDVSLRTNMTMRETIARRMLDDGEVQWIGNAIVFLDKYGVYMLIVSCSGLSDIADEAAAELIASKVKRKLLTTQKQLELAA